jgi:protein O-mannose beta-1,4-N-acetylglucosaminyltransferase
MVNGGGKSSSADSRGLTIIADSNKPDKKVSSEANSGISRRIFRKLPPTSIWCYGEKRKDRICRFKNLYYHPDHHSWFAVITENSVLHNVPIDRSPALIDLTTIEDHSVFYFDYNEVLQSTFTNVVVNAIEKRTFLISRFHVGNIMHTMHDDVIGLYHVIKRFAPVDNTGNKPDFANFDLDHFIQFYDEHTEGAYGHIFNLLTNNPIRYRSALTEDPTMITMFEDIYVGNSKITSWYQYGFLVPQGPIPVKSVYGYHIRQAADFISWKLGIHESQVSEFSKFKPKADHLVIFSRKDNRLIVNENDLLEQLSSEFSLKGTFLRMEDHSFKEQIQILKRTRVAAGMHGSMLIMSMFMPPGSVLVEMYPFAVPGDNYTPYKTLCGLPGMNLQYVKWENKHEDKSIMHPENSMYQGGLMHLSETERKKVIDTKTVPTHTCCMDPYWLFRIYQDTIVEVSELVTDISEGFLKSKEKKLDRLVVMPVIQPSTIDSKSIKVIPVYEKDSKVVQNVQLKWAAPWNGVVPEKYSIWEHIAHKEFTSATPFLEMQSSLYKVGTKLEIWIRTVNAGVVGKYSDKLEFVIPDPLPDKVPSE